MSDVQRHLTKKEWLTYEACKLMVRSGVGVSFTVQSAKDHIAALEALSACRALLKKHQWVQLELHHPNYLFCLECHESKENGHKPDCKWDAQLKGTRGE